jgi:hypothetical protein
LAARGVVLRDPFGANVALTPLNGEVTEDRVAQRASGR